MDHRSEFLKGQDRIALSSHTGSTPPIARLAGAASGETTVTPFCPLSPILQSERQVVTNPAVHHGTDLLLVTFSFVLLFAPLFRRAWGPPTQFHSVPFYRWWSVVFPATVFPVLSILSFSLCFSTWLAESCCGRVVLLVLKFTSLKTRYLFVCLFIYVCIYIYTYGKKHGTKWWIFQQAMLDYRRV